MGLEKQLPDAAGPKKPSISSEQEALMAKGKKVGREHVWLQCTECNMLNYRTSMNLKGGLPEKMKAGLQKYCSKSRTHTLHKVKRK